ncbi:PAS domain-containing protein [Desulfolutivibrio sulfoxidireducens]|nr:PAS domain-containing protein [Desulfolutivibrio sulfoxidireducens]
MRMTSIRRKFIVTVGGITLLTLLVGTYFLVFISRLDTAADSTLPRTYRVVEAADAAGDAARMLDVAARALITNIDPDIARDIDQYDTLFRISLRQAKDGIPRPFTREEALHARRLTEQYTIYIAVLRDMAAPETDQGTRSALYAEQLRPLHGLISSDADRLKDLARQRIDQLLDQARESSRQATRRMIILLCCASAVCLLSVYFFERSVLRPVRRIKKLALEIKDGNLEARADIRTTGKRRDEIAQLAQAFNEMAHARSLAEGELMRASQALRASDSLNRAIIDSTSDMVAALDTNCRIILQNEAFVRECAALFGVTPTVGDHLPSLLSKHPEAQKWAETLWGRALAGEHFHVTKDIRLLKTGPRSYDFHFDPLYGDQGTIVGALQTGRDVTEQTRMERELREAATELDRRVRERTGELMGLMESIPAVVWIARDPECRTIYGNRAAHEFLGLPPGQNLSLTPKDASPPAHFKIFSHGVELPPYELPMQAVGRDGVEMRNVEIEMRFADGKNRWLLGNASPLRDESGAVTGVVGAFVDITERKGLERDLRAAKEAAEHASLAKSRFLADVSHEIRTPMNAIIGIADVLMRTSLSEEQLEFVRTIREAAGHLLELLNDILDLAKIEADKLEPQCADFDPGQLLDSVVKTFSLSAREKGIGLTLRQAPDIPARLHGDARRLRQILVNLVGNAVKFTERGEVALSVTRDAAADTGDAKTVTLRFTVRDTGIGIPPERLPHIFDDFIQAHPDHGEKYGGTGLGLAISRKLAHVLGGDIQVTSREGQGSVFTATATFAPAGPEDVRPPASPAGADRADKAAPPKAPRPRPGKILLVEDNPVNVKVAELHLEKMGHAVTVAEDGPKALTALAREPFDVVLMDLELPGMDGITTTRRIRLGEAGRDRTGTPIVAMTAHAQDDIRKQCLTAGMDDYMTKPVNFFELEALISRLLIRPESEALAGQPPLFDKERAMRRMGIDEATLAPIFQAALDEFGERLDDLLRATKRGDIQTIRTHCHTLKSICGTIGFAQGQGILEKISEAARNADIKAVRHEVRELGRLFGLGLAETKKA